MRNQTQRVEIETGVPTQPAGPILSARNLTKLYNAGTAREVVALTDVNFDIFPGDLVSIVGPSGCGKSTLLRALAGLSRPTAGSLLIDGEPLINPGPKAAMVFQQPVLLPWRTILDNVMLPIEFRELPIANHRAHALDLLASVGLAGFEARFPHELSGGMQQRAGICRALARDPRILLMDEPFGALDALTRERMNLELQRIWQESGKTIVLITHSISEAIFLGDRVLVMSARPGRVLRDITVPIPRPRSLDTIIAHPAYGEIAREIRGLLNAEGTVD